MESPKEKGPKAPRIWHDAHETILKEWGEAAACYRYMHFQAYKSFKKRNMHFTLPIIVISTVTGTANFAQSTFPSNWQPYVPSVIGAMNLCAAIMTTVLQFLKVTELMEGHRLSYVSYAKLSRNIRLELSLPDTQRTQHGSTMVEVSGNEYGRLMEQSPMIPNKTMIKFREKFSDETIGTNNAFTRPEIFGIKIIKPYAGTKDKRIINEAMEELKIRMKKQEPTVKKCQTVKDTLLEELRALRNRNSSDVVIDVDVMPSHGLSVRRLAELFETGDFDNDVQEHAE